MNPVAEALDQIRAGLGSPDDLPEPEFLTPEEEIEAALSDYRAACRSKFLRRIPVAVRSALDNLRKDDATLAVMRETWGIEPPHSPACTLIGVPGSGKTVAACYAALRMIGHYSRPASFIAVDKFALSVGMGADSPDWGYVLDCHRWAGERGRIIILDDLGRERVSEAVVDRIRMLLRAVYERHGRLVVTTNFSIIDIGERYGSEVRSRFMDEAWMTLIVGPTRDYRLKGEN